MALTRTEFLERFSTFRYNPGGIQRIMIGAVEDIYNGEIELFDPTNPMVELMECGATLGAALMQQAESLTQRQYRNLALTPEDLYCHMSDRDYIGRFATPASTTLGIIVSKAEVYEQAVATGSDGSRKLVLPRHSRFTVAGIPFTLQYPVEIRIMSHGGLQLVYNNDRPSPLQTLASNLVDWAPLNYNTDREEYLQIRLPIQQMHLKSQLAQLNGAQGFKARYSYTDQFYYCRAYRALSDGRWEEIRTTHTDQVYDPLVPTLVLSVDPTAQTLEAMLPQVYFTTGLANTELRIDIYTTRGPLALPLSTYNENNFLVEWIDLDQDDNGRYSAPLKRLNTLRVFGYQAVEGGANGLSFEALRERSTTNSTGGNDIPVTPAQITAALAQRGFGSVRYVDNLTKRIYVATRSLPAPTTGNVSTGAGLTTAQLAARFEDLAGLETVNDHGERLTLLPTTLYRDVGGALTLVSDAERASLAGLDTEALAEAVNADRFLYTPFHYVLDITEQSMAARAYYLDAPVISAKAFIDENDTLGVGISLNTHRLTRQDDGWRLLVMTTSGEGFRALDDSQINVQLSFVPAGELSRAYLNGTLLYTDPDTGERLYEFILNSTFDINSEHEVALTNFSLYDSAPRTLYAPLSTEFDLVFILSNRHYPGQAASPIDESVGTYLLPAGSLGLYQERLTLRLGQAMDGLWNRARTSIGAGDYQTYEEPVYQTYSTDIYEVDERGLAVYTVVDGQVVFNKLHSRGDQVLVDGVPQVLHEAGDPVLVEGEPILAAPRTLLRLIDLVLVDGVYYFATTDTDVAYRNSIPATIETWLSESLAGLEANLFEETDLVYLPLTTLGLVSAKVEANEEVKLYAEQRLTVKLYVTRTVYRDYDLRELLTNMVGTTLTGPLSQAVVTQEGLEATLKAALGQDVITVALEGLGGTTRGYPVITLLDDSARLTLGKRLVSMADGALEVEDAITVEYVQHTQQ